MPGMPLPQSSIEWIFLRKKPGFVGTVLSTTSSVGLKYAKNALADGARPQPPPLGASILVPSCAPNVKPWLRPWFSTMCVRLHIILVLP